MHPMKKLPVVVLISGRGSNLQAIIDATKKGELPVTICAVISNRPQAQGLERARKAGIETIALDHTRFDSREAFDQALQHEIDRFKPGLVILAGYMRILTPAFVEHYLGRMLNIHPSLLPRYPGLDTHSRVLENGDSEHGASVHFVTTELDGGPVVLQVKVPVLPGDTSATLADRVLEQEHRIYCKAIEWFSQGRLKLQHNHAWLDDKQLETPCILEPESGEILHCAS